MRKLFKRRIWVDATGKKCSKNTPGATLQTLPNWYFRLSVNGRDRWVKGYTDKTASATLMAEKLKQIARGEAGLIDTFAPHAKRPLMEHVADYLSESTGKGNDSEWIYTVGKRLHKMISACGWSRLPDVTSASFIRFRDTGEIAALSPKTRNEYQQTIRAFCRWCVSTGRMPIDPFRNMNTVKVNGDIRRERRALSDDEIARLLAVVPSYRKACYLFAILTGLRRAELRQLKWADLHLDSPKPFANVRASTTKNGRQAIVFLRDDLVAELKSLPHETEYVFVVPQIQTFYNDLKAAGIPAKDSLGRVADFHALRHTLATNLARSGVSIRTAMEVMRHSDSRLTTKTYTDASLLPTAQAIECLPRWEVVKADQALKTGTDSGATVCATVLPSFGVKNSPKLSQSRDSMDMQQTRMDSEETCDNSGDFDGGGKLHQLGLEPRTR